MCLGPADWSWLHAVYCYVIREQQAMVRAKKKRSLIIIYEDITRVSVT